MTGSFKVVAIESVERLLTKGNVYEVVEGDNELYDVLKMDNGKSGGMYKFRFAKMAPENTAVNPKDMLGAKKPDLSLVPPVATLHEAVAFMDGAEKYGPFNWRDKKVQARVYTAAAKRHIDAWSEGEEYSPDTVAKGRPVHHLAHARACLAILLDAQETGCLADNRPKNGVYSAVLDRMAKFLERYQSKGR